MNCVWYENEMFILFNAKLMQKDLSLSCLFFNFEDANLNCQLKHFIHSCHFLI